MVGSSFFPSSQKLISLFLKSVPIQLARHSFSGIPNKSPKASEFQKSYVRYLT